MILFSYCIDIQRTTGCKTVEYWHLDLQSFASVSAFATRFEKEGGGKLDILVENAAIATRKYQKTSDGYESTYVHSPPPLEACETLIDNG